MDSTSSHFSLEVPSQEVPDCTRSRYPRDLQPVESNGTTRKAETSCGIGITSGEIGLVETLSNGRAGLVLVFLLLRGVGGVRKEDRKET